MNATHALGWALVHFLWQGAALAALLAVVLALTPPRAARTRYTLSLLALVAMLVIPVATAVRSYQPLSETRRAATSPAPAPGSPATETGSTAAVAPAGPVGPAGTVGTRFSSLREGLDPMLPWLVTLWVGGVLLLSVRLTHGWLGARRLRITGTRPASAPLLAALHQLAARLRVSRPVQLVESLIVEVPAVIGWLRPVILVPSSALTGLTPQQLEVLLAHELAHVRRYDYLVNIVQCVIETLLFYHPAVWWVSRRMREEREHCCDDLVVQACGDAQLYASALVEMERLRPATPRLALAATGSGGSLLTRVRRLILPATARSEFLPRWAAGVAGVVAVTIALLATGGDRVAAAIADAAVQSDTTRLSPDTVLVHPDPAQPLAQRWDWARAQARQLGKRTFWIGYTVSRPEWLEHSMYVDRGTEVVGENIRMSGRLFGDFQGLAFRGVRLGPLIKTRDSDDIAILLGFTADQSGKTALMHVHVASFYLPVDFRGRSLFWLGAASDVQSLPLVQDLFSSAPQAELREDLVSAIGVHGSSETVVPILQRILTGRDPKDVRAQAAEWLGFHPTRAAVNALSAAARNDAVSDVRREAAEALGDNGLPAATDSIIAVARTASDAEARREAVEGLAQKEPESALPALTSIAQTDRDEDVQREAVETLGELPNGRGLNAVREIARTHRNAEVRREAVETLGENLPPAEAVTTLKALAINDSDPDVAREAIESLGELKGNPGALAAITDFARTHPNSDARRKAVATLADLAPTAETARLLATLATSDRDEDVQRQAIETLGELGDAGLPAVIDVARTHPNSDVRRKAIETIAEHAPAAQSIDLLSQIARRDRDSDVQRAAVEALGEIHDDRASSLIVEFARTHPNSDVRRKAIETLGDSRQGRDTVISILADAARSSGDPDVARQAVETLGEMGDARATAVVARIARGSGDVDVRRKAIEAYSDAAPVDSVLALYKGILATDAPEDLTSKILESLEEMDNGAGIPVLIDVARSHPNRDVRADALRRLGESDDPRAQQVFERTLRRP